LTELETVIRTRLLSQMDDCSKGGAAMSQREWILRTIQDSCSNTIEVTGSKALLAEDPEKALFELYRQYCGVRDQQPSSETRTRKLTERNYIRARMRSAF